MTFNSKLTPYYEDYLLHLYFGSVVETDPLTVCVDKAYLDFNRTLHGIRKLPDGSKLHAAAVGGLKSSLADLKEMLQKGIDQSTFDAWHEDTCKKLIAVYDKSHTFYGGQTQKWVNMTLKYIFTLGEERISGFDRAYPYCHAPLDRIVVEGLAKFGFPPLTCFWSRLDYREYFERQQWIRNNFILVPLDVEFLIWLGKPIEERYLRKVVAPVSEANAVGVIGSS
jgi:hypothetical protein